MSVVLVAEMDCGRGEMDVTAGEPRLTTTVQMLSKGIEAALIRLISFTPYVSQ